MHVRIGAAAIVAAVAVFTLGGTVSDGPQCKKSSACLAEHNADGGPGIVASSIGGRGIESTSRKGVGIFGGTFDDTSQNFNAGAGVYGADESTDVASGDAGILGTSTYGLGVYGVTFNPSKTDALPGVAVAGNDLSDDFGLLNIGVLGIAYGTGIVGSSLAPPQPAGLPQYPGVLAYCTGGGMAMLADNGYGSPGGDVMSLDCAGNEILKGTLVTNGTPYMGVRSDGGPPRATFAAMEARPAIEDIGEGTISGGAGHVAIDASFARSMDPRGGYSVFLTPEGPSEGLYVTAKTPDGFDVRENPGGHASIAFSYRIDATPLGESGRAMPLLRDVADGLYREAAAAPHSNAMIRAVRLPAAKKLSGSQ